MEIEILYQGKWPRGPQVQWVFNNRLVLVTIPESDQKYTRPVSTDRKYLILNQTNHHVDVFGVSGKSEAEILALAADIINYVEQRGDKTNIPNCGSFLSFLKDASTSIISEKVNSVIGTIVKNVFTTDDRIDQVFKNGEKPGEKELFHED